MKLYTASSQEDVKCFDIARLREPLRVDNLFQNAGSACGSGTDTISTMGRITETDIKKGTKNVWK